MGGGNTPRLLGSLFVEYGGEGRPGGEGEDAVGERVLDAHICYMPILFGRTGEKADGDRRGGNASQAAGLLENGGRMGRVGEDTVGGGMRRAPCPW